LTRKDNKIEWFFYLSFGQFRIFGQKNNAIFLPLNALVSFQVEFIIFLGIRRGRDKEKWFNFIGKF